MKPTIFLDMDGVCVDLVHDVCRLFDRDYKSALKDWPEGVYEVSTALQLSMDEEALWHTVNFEGKQFWRNLPEIFPFWNLYEALTQRGDVVFLTKPNFHPDCVEGKLHWLQDRFGLSFGDYVFTKHKHYCASHEGAILLDDSDKNVEDFRRHGGRAVLFPQPWNTGRTLGVRAGQAEHLEHVIAEVDRAVREVGHGQSRSGE